MKIYRRSGHGGRLDETVLRGADRETARAALAFASENGLLSMVHVEATVSRYYPFSDLAAQVIDPQKPLWYLGISSVKVTLPIHSSLLLLTSVKYPWTRLVKSE